MLAKTGDHVRLATFWITSSLQCCGVLSFRGPPGTFKRREQRVLLDLRYPESHSNQTQSHYAMLNQRSEPKCMHKPCGSVEDTTDTESDIFRPPSGPVEAALAAGSKYSFRFMADENWRTAIILYQRRL